MKILDRTPYRTETGEIDLIGRIRGTLQYGLNWYPQLEAQKAVIAVLDKVLKDGYVLARNVTLAETEINLPLVLLGPQGVFLINVIHERGVYRARDDEWGTVSGEKFAPAAVNQIQRTLKLGRVLQVYLDRAGFKDQVNVESLLMSADPGMHIDSTRPAVRIILSDALERFAISINQARPTLNASTVFKVTKIIMNGPEEKAEAAPIPANMPQPAAPSETQSSSTDSGFGSKNDDFKFSFDETPEKTETSSHYDFGEADTQNNPFQDGAFQNATFQESEAQPENSPAQADQQPERSQIRTAGSKKKGLFGLTTPQILLLSGLLLFWLCAMAAFAVYIFYFA